MFLRYKDQEIVNSQYIVFIERDKKQILFIFSNPIIRVNWRCETEEEAKKLFKELQIKLNTIDCS